MNSKASSSAPTARSATEARLFGRLSGPSSALDPRVNAFRNDLADVALASRVVASHYVAAARWHTGLAVAPMRDRPRDDAAQVSELLPGEAFAVFELIGDARGWAWGQGASDGYVGWVRRAVLTLRAPAAPVPVTVPHALIFAAPSIKACVVALLPLGAMLDLTPGDGDFLALDGGAGFVHRRHVTPADGDSVDLARGFVGTPYHWGGRTRAGIDCSGLTQAVLHAKGICCPRDSDQQRAAFAPVEFAARRRGDLVCLPGHIGLLADPDTLLHANAWWMTTLAEPLADVLARQPAAHAVVVRPPCDPLEGSL